MSIPYTPPTHRPHDTGGFFRHHGLWAMGIRLFRRLRFGAKAAIVSGLFLVPALIGFSLYLGQVQRDIEQSRGELAGVQLIEKLAPVLQALTDLRNASRANGASFAPAASLLQQGHAALQRAETELQRVDQQFVSHLQLVDEAAALHRTLSGLPLGASAQTVEDVLEQTVNFYNLLSARSGVILDQDSADLQLLLAYTREIPFLAEAVGQMRSWGTVALIKQRQDATSMQRVYGWTAGRRGHRNTWPNPAPGCRAHATPTPPWGSCSTSRCWSRPGPTSSGPTPPSSRATRPWWPMWTAGGRRAASW